MLYLYKFQIPRERIKSFSIRETHTEARNVLEIDLADVGLHCAQESPAVYSRPLEARSRGSNLSIPRVYDREGTLARNVRSSSSHSLFPHVSMLLSLPPHLHYSVPLFSLSLSRSRFRSLAPSLSFRHFLSLGAVNWTQTSLTVAATTAQCSAALHVVALVSTSMLLVSLNVLLALALGAHRKLQSNSLLHRADHRLPLFALRHRHLHLARAIRADDDARPISRLLVCVRVVAFRSFCCQVRCSLLKFLFFF